jgi:phosphate transport system protein
MLFSDFVHIWKKTTLLSEATDTCTEMLRTGLRMFQYSMRVLLDNEKEVEDIYAIDREMNRHEISVRRKVAEHLAVNPEQDYVAALFLSTIVGDIERIGDYCKNVIELAHHYPEKLEGPYIDRIREIEAEVTRLHTMTVEAFEQGDSELGRKAMELQAELSRQCDALTDKLLAETEMPGRDAVIRALLLRFLKRVSAHLKNVASSLVNPYHKLGYKPDGSPDDPDE